MAMFVGSSDPDVADATTGAITGFTGGSLAELTDAVGDSFFGLAGDDIIKAGSGDDHLRGGLGADVLWGGAGVDTVDYLDNWGAVFVNLTIGLGFENAAEGDTYNGIENVVATIFNDFIIGDNGANVLDGSQGDDYLIGSLGGDALIGGTGFDIASYEENAGAIFINMRSGMGYGNAAQGDTFSSIEGIVGTSFDDYIISNSATSTKDGSPTVSVYVDAGAGNDYVISGDGGDTLKGGIGEDTVSYELNFAAVNVSLANGGGSLDTLSGFEDVVGSRFNDFIYGDNNNNVLYGKFGNDTLFGGEGRDTFVFDTSLTASGPNVDTIIDFSEYDFIYLNRNTAFTALAPGQLPASALAFGTAATTADQHIVYNQATGALFYDPDGVGGAAAVQFALLGAANAPHPAITADMFYVIG